MSELGRAVTDDPRLTILVGMRVVDGQLVAAVNGDTVFLSGRPGDPVQRSSIELDPNATENATAFRAAARSAWGGSEVDVPRAGMFRVTSPTSLYVLGWDGAPSATALAAMALVLSPVTGGRPANAGAGRP